jgi:hypothetical protein
MRARGRGQVSGLVNDAPFIGTPIELAFLKFDGQSLAGYADENGELRILFKHEN